MSDILVTTHAIGRARIPDARDPTRRIPESSCETFKLIDTVARPKFSATAKVAEWLERCVEDRGGAPCVVPWVNDAKDGRAVYPYGTRELPVGLSHDRSETEPGLTADEYRWHPDAAPSFAEARKKHPPTFSHVFFPLLASVLPKWIDAFADDAGPGADARDAARAMRAGSSRGFDGNLARVRRVVYLVSGYGAPADAARAPESNSTEAVARVMKRFIEVAYPDACEVRLAHSGNGVFRYESNVAFVHEKLRPRVVRDRDSVSVRFGEDWSRRFDLTVALCDGTPARLHALMSSFRDMRPFLAHAFQLKRFWQTGALDTDDVDIQRWTGAEAAPPARAAALREVFAAAAGASSDAREKARLDAAVLLKIVEEMKRHRDAFTRVGNGSAGEHELASFWLRKTRKPVLAVLCVLKRTRERARGASVSEDDFELFRGVNLEVSMPTGSLCSERNAVGNALASNPGLRRGDMFGIAVLSLRERDIHPAGSGSETETDVDGAGPTSTRGASRGGSLANVADGLENGNAAPRRTAPPRVPTDGDGIASRKTRRDDPTNLNPLRPCGACQEWLKKIAEVNPGFRVLMFSDVTCEEVYVREVGQCGGD